MQKTLNTGTRIGSMILDHLLMTMICSLFSVPLFIRQITNVFTVSHDAPDPGLNGPWTYLSILGFALYFCKDCLNGRSLAKRITRLQVVDHRTGKVASAFKCFIRDLFIVLWPVEVIMTLINPARRLGDYVAGTSVVVYDPSVVPQPAISIRSLILPVILSYGLLLLLILLPMQQLITTHSGKKYVSSSYNAAESQSLEKMYTDHFGERLTASVRVYDKMETGNKKYVSIIFRLKQNEPGTGQLEESTKALLYARYPETALAGRAQYVWQGNGSMNIHAIALGTPVSE